MSEGTDDSVAVAATASALDPRVTPEAEPLPAPTLFEQLAARRMAAATKHAPFGITAAMLGDYLNRDAPATADELAALTEDTARDILYRRYWLPIAGDRLPEPVAAALFDVAVRRGVDEAVKLLQRATQRVEPMTLKQDGRLGLQTLGAIDSLVQAGKEVALAERVIAERGTFAFRLFDGKLFGRDVDAAGALLLVGKTLIRAKTGVRLP